MVPQATGGIQWPGRSSGGILILTQWLAACKANEHRVVQSDASRRAGFLGLFLRLPISFLHRPSELNLSVNSFSSYFVQSRSIVLSLALLEVLVYLILSFLRSITEIFFFPNDGVFSASSRACIFLIHWTGMLHVCCACIKHALSASKYWSNCVLFASFFVNDLRYQWYIL